jgi:hypothetical protein
VVVHPIVGQRAGQTKTAKINTPKLFSKQSKILQNQPISEDFWSCWADSNCRPHPYQLSI